MSKKQPGDIKVVGEDRMCFWADPVSLEPRGVSRYDAYAFSDPEPVPTISFGEYCVQRNKLLFPGIAP